MKDIITTALAIIGLFLGSEKALIEFHNAARKETIKVLVQNQPSLESFTQKLISH